MLKSGWISWETGAVDGDDRFVTTANAVGLTFLLRGSVRVEWECFGQRKSEVFSPGMSECRPADGQEHRYRHRWETDSASISVQIPAGQLALIVNSDEALGKIAELVGFSSQGHLSFAFLRVTGITPGFARRRALRPLPISRGIEAG